MGDQVIKGIILDHFNQTLKEHGQGPQAVSYGSEQSQQVRFAVLSEIGNLDQSSILDVGCGLGDLYHFLALKEKLQLNRYLGVDINPLMIQKAQQRYPQAEFALRDLLESPLQEGFDYVLACGIFNLWVPDWEQFTSQTLSRMYALCRIGVGVNFLSRFSPFNKDKLSYYADPAKILDFICSNLSPNIVLRQDYKANDFTVYIYKDSRYPSA